MLRLAARHALSARGGALRLSASSRRGGGASTFGRGTVGTRALLSSTPKWEEYAKDVGLSSVRGVGQVVFCDKVVEGGLILGGLFVGDPGLAAGAALGGASATVAAQAMGGDRATVERGLASYNGVLVGAAFSAFLPGAALAPTVAAAAATAPLSAAFGRLCGRVPQYTLAFNAVALSALAFVRPLAEAAPAAAAAAQASALDVVRAPLVGVSQIFVVDSPLTGAAILLALARADPAHAAHALAGSALGSCVGLALGAPVDEVVHGLWGFNSALAALGVSVFFSPSAASRTLAAGGAASAAVVFGGLKTAMGAAFAVPALTLPFCAVAACCHVLPDAGVAKLTRR